MKCVDIGWARMRLSRAEPHRTPVEPSSQGRGIYGTDGTYDVLYDSGTALVRCSREESPRSNCYCFSLS